MGIADEAKLAAEQAQKAAMAAKRSADAELEAAKEMGREEAAYESSDAENLARYPVI